jgi:hypothetical protein
MSALQNNMYPSMTGEKYIHNFICGEGLKLILKQKSGQIRIKIKKTVQYVSHF